MNEEKLLSAEAADRLLACADGDAALLYLHILRSGGYVQGKAARELKRGEADIALAADTLRRLGLLDAVRPQPQSRETPEYTAQDIVQRAETDGAFSGVVDEAERTLGRVLSSNDLRLLLGIYDHLGLPADVMMMLLHHCVEEYQEDRGAGRMPTMRYIEKEARFWADQEICDLDAAEEHIRRGRARREQTEQVKEVLGLVGRELVAGERKYVDAWLTMGFGPETLAIAYDRTMTSTGKLAWSYMDKIVRSWNEKKLYTPEAVEAGDPRGGSGKKQEKTERVSDSEKLQQMRRTYEKLKGGEG